MPVSFSSRYYGFDVLPAEGRDSNVLALRLADDAELQATYPDSILHVLVGDETLDQLAALYFGREDLWWRIADANPTKYPFDWQAGDSLVIPPIRVATRTQRK